MKKVVLFFCLLFSSIYIYAQKNYITMRVYGTGDTPTVKLDGDIPVGMDNYIPNENGNHNDTGFLGVTILNRLSEYGYEVEQMIPYNVSTQSIKIEIYYLLAKKSSSNPSNVRRVIIDDEDVTEVARYNLQGMPIYANEKGIQIIVYSNYTTKTVIVQ